MSARQYRVTVDYRDQNTPLTIVLGTDVGVALLVEASLPLADFIKIETVIS